VTVPITSAVHSVSGASSVQSTSSQGASVVIVQFADGTDLKSAEQDMNAAISRIRAQLPQQATAPSVQTFSTSSQPILIYSVTSNQPLGDLAGQLRSKALPTLQGLAGVTSVVITGAPTDEVDVTLDPAKLTAHGVTIGQVAAALQQATVVESLGSVQAGSATIPLQISDSLTSLDQISSVMVNPAAGAPTSSAGSSGFAGTQNNRAGASGAVSAPVKVGDLGSVQQVEVAADTITRTDGTPSIGLEITKDSAASTVTVANEVKSALPGIESSIGHGINVVAIQDQGSVISRAISDIVEEGLIGAAFAILVIFLFLRSGRATVVTAISIPLSLLITLIVLWWQGITLNVLTLGALMVAIGRVVDDSIVVLENISRHVAEGESPLSAANTASREILSAVTSSTLTTIGVFLPIALLSGIFGSFFRPFGLTVVVALLASLAVAVTVVPLLGARLLRPRPNTHSGPRPLGWMQRGYVPVIRWAIRRRVIAVALGLVIFVTSMAMVPHLRVNLFDQGAFSSFTVSLAMPENSTLTQTDAETQSVEKLINGISGIDNYKATVGGLSQAFGPEAAAPADPTQAQILITIAIGQGSAVIERVNIALKQYAGPAKLTVGSGFTFGNSNQMQVDLSSSDPTALQTANDAVLAALATVNGLTQIQSNLAASKPEYQVVPTDQLVQYGLTAQGLASIVAQDVNGQVAAQVALPAGTMSVRVRMPSGYADTASEIAALPIPTSRGTVPLSTLATIQSVTGAQTIGRVNGNRDATITGTITGNDTRTVQSDVTKALASVTLPSGVTLTTGGAFANLSTAISQFAFALVAAIALVYLVMVATFRSLLKPLILLVSIPLAASGAIVALRLTDTSLSLPGMVGLLMLTGIVVTNAIVLLDLVEQYREQGLDLESALIQGGTRRLRPILMTAFATMLALLPLAVSGSTSGGFISAPLAVVVIGGLFSSTLLTLILVPALYSLASRFTGARVRSVAEPPIDAHAMTPAAQKAS
jgi:hydrophobic/amphiphilic exporter-1 (mainly G- bacteria), HAE1 family